VFKRFLCRGRLVAEKRGDQITTYQTLDEMVSRTPRQSQLSVTNLTAYFDGCAILLHYEIVFSGSSFEKAMV